MDTTTWTDGPLGRIQLNRPRTINALTPTMIAEIREAIHAFEHDPAITAIAVDGAGERGLCSGADVRAIREAILTKGNEAAGEFWRTEYAMNAEIHALTTPYAAFMDGIVMGGGVGVSTYGSIRVTTPRTRLAMPETGIGLFPDVGTMFTLSRAPGQLGTHMALTGLPVSGADAVIAGFADAVIDPQA
ncbi:MAG TPA: enoyl-CoA hydratase/isomerase family protein, partial [Beutenbergiaceae bacterium]|nr:enoyl-CoA hydratase/isomerase family protein [Beutenbergiaceae bacterium]